ncbi:hypothetical protein OHB12_29825 [Nocardia sp. NBC_01730]|uniref:hypothetical protein n=1 Tax=Nocardia sp. NBC_01730 TaxID=2975998 RepID=UPI002E11EA5D|nr:hypothetical protein OHB12_29825 [Nocardia sp. NBC_01730]
MNDRTTAETTTVLSIGLHPSAIDYSRYPDLDEATLTARIEAGDAALREAGFDIVACPIPAAPDQAEAKIRECAAAGPFRVAMIGAGVRVAPEHTLLFERLMNLLTDIAPGIRFCFNTSPETTIDALQRWVQPGKTTAPPTSPHR